jgi:hypothetical protein
VAGGDAEQLGGARRGRADERLELGVEVGDLAVERLDAAGERPQRELGRLRRAIELARVGSQPPAECGLGADRLALRELLTQPAGVR